MPRKTAPLLPATSELLSQLGNRLRLARLRRRLSAKQVAERAGMNPMTLRNLERGRSGVTIGAYLAVMQVLGIEKELDYIAQADPLGRSLQDARLTGADVTRKASDTPRLDTLAQSATKKATKKTTKETTQKTTKKHAIDTRNAASEGAFISSRDLVTLLKRR